MRLMIDDCHRRGEPLAALWAAEGAIYQRFGFGLATMSVNLEAETRSVGFAPRLAARRDVPDCSPRARAASSCPHLRGRRWPSVPASSREHRPWWIGILPLVDKDAKGGEARRLVVYETDAGPEAYAVYKTKSDWNDRGPAGHADRRGGDRIHVRGTREIWRYLFEVDLVSEPSRPGACPSTTRFSSLAAEPRRLGTHHRRRAVAPDRGRRGGAGGSDVRAGWPR